MVEKRGPKVAASKKKRRRFIVGEPVEYPPFIVRSWYILPVSENPVIAHMMNQVGSNLAQAKAKLVEYSTSFKKGTWASPRLLGISEQHVSYAYRVIHMNEYMQRIMQRFATRWRFRRLVKANEEDLITMEKPLKPVELYDWAQRRIYSFEAATIFQCIKKRLLYHEGMFATPLKPVNPYTNTNLSPGQLHHILEQLRSYGLTHWCLEAIRTSVYCLGEFKLVNDMALQLEAMKHVFKDLAGADFRDTIFDYIESEYCINEEEMDKATYRWAITHAMDNEHMVKWRKLCYAYYKNQIVFRDVPLKRHIIEVKLSSDASKLCRWPRELRAMRRRAEKITGVVSEDLLEDQ